MNNKAIWICMECGNTTILDLSYRLCSYPKRECNHGYINGSVHIYKMVAVNESARQFDKNIIALEKVWEEDRKKRWKMDEYEREKWKVFRGERPSLRLDELPNWVP